MRLELTARADKDLRRIRRFNEDRSEAWAARVQNRLLSRMDDLTGTANCGRPFRRPGVFRLSMTDIQYVIDYRRGKDFVRILRVQHSREIR